MRRLTFSGFLQSYVRALSGADTLALATLVRRATEEPRLVEPLLLWAAVSGRAGRLLQLLEHRGDLRAELRHLADLQASGTLERALDAESRRLRPEYGKVWRSYVVRRDAHLRDERLRLQARQRVLALESEKHVTRYRMAKDLGLNPGNLHAFLTKGDATKLSLDRAVELVRYLEAA